MESLSATSCDQLVGLSSSLGLLKNAMMVPQLNVVDNHEQVTPEQEVHVPCMTVYELQEEVTMYELQEEVTVYELQEEVMNQS